MKYQTLNSKEYLAIKKDLSWGEKKKKKVIIIIKKVCTAWISHLHWENYQNILLAAKYHCQKCQRCGLKGCHPGENNMIESCVILDKR